MILILGGTTEAMALARLMAEQGWSDAVLSLAGRTRQPALPPIPHRSGGFGGITGLVAYLEANRVAAVVDATHPFAEQMSAHAVEACRQAGVALLRLARPAWTPVAGDRWTEVADSARAVATLGEAPRRVFLTVGRLELPAFLAAPQHFYLVRSVDPPEAMPPRGRLILARGPFAEADERALMQADAIEILVTKNSGGAATYGKIAAARALTLPVIVLAPPPVPAGIERVETAEAALAWLGTTTGRHGAAATLRGV